jgi:pimeloyl-ACP methyl ester carboxylesterase
VAQRAALDGFEAGPLYEVDQPALVVHGGADRAVPAAAGRELADGLPRGEFEAYPDAGHLVCVERSQPVNDRLLGFLDRRR